MIKRPVNYIFIEGPDLSGKTTLYNKIHSHTNYRWNIQDRSALSMLTHAKQYGRNEFSHIEQLRSELFNLNNLIIILLPPWQVISKRFTERGDEIQNLASLKQVYDIFVEAASELSKYPNVIVVNDEVDEQLSRYLVSKIREYEDASTLDIKVNCLNAAYASSSNECIGLNFTLFDDGSFDDIDSGDLLYDEEVDYYNDILLSVKNKIFKEINGENEYGRKEDEGSRRFIYSSDTCISLAHFLVRNNTLDCKYFVRSSNVKDTLYYDINFLKHLSSEVFNILDIKDGFCRMSFMINSSHILDIIEEE
jgi:thymidylate kinase